MKKTLSLILFITVIGTNLMAQQSTTGPEPPPGLDPGLQIDKKAQTVISGVPTYLWQHGCGPTALGMVVGFYDLHGYSSLISGDAAIQNSAVNAMIADDSDNPSCGGPASDHFQDYSCPIDYYPTMLTDRSQTGGTHTDNCVADFMRTSRSIAGNYYGWSWFSDVDNAFKDYVNIIDPLLTPYADNYSFSQFTFEDYMVEINNNNPVVLLVDTDGNGSTDHFVTGVGYDEETMTYGIYNTWDYDLHWYLWRNLASGHTWGIYGVTVISLGQLSVYDTEPADGASEVSVKTDITVSFNLDLDINTLNETNILVVGAVSGVHDLEISYYSPTHVVNINPVTEFSSYEVVEVILSENICSIGGLLLGQDFTFEFATGSCCVNYTGNADCSLEEQPDISDITRLIDYLYLSHNPLCCLPEADCDLSGGEPDISDITFLIDHLYLSHRLLLLCP